MFRFAVCLGRQLCRLNMPLGTVENCPKEHESRTENFVHMEFTCVQSEILFFSLCCHTSQSRQEKVHQKQRINYYYCCEILLQIPQQTISFCQPPFCVKTLPKLLNHCHTGPLKKKQHMLPQHQQVLNQCKGKQVQENLLQVCDLSGDFRMLCCCSELNF